MTITINAVRNETRVNTTTAGNQYYSATAALADGGYVVAWQGPQQDGWTGTDIFLQRYDASGAKVGGEVTVNTATTGDQTGPIDIVGLSNGGFVVTWDQNASPYNDDAYRQVFDSAGARVGAAVQIDLAAAGAMNGWSMTASPTGGYLGAWQGRALVSGVDVYTVYTQKFDAAGNPIGTQTSLSGTGGTTEILALPNGDYVVVFGKNGLMSQRYSASGNPIGSTESLIPYGSPSSLASGQKGAVLANGDYVLVWQASHGDGNLDGVFSQRFDGGGTKVGDPTLVNTYTTGSQIQPAVTALADGGYLVAWQSWEQDGSNYGVYSQRFDASGARVGVEERVPDTTYDAQYNPSVVSLAGGGHVIVWDATDTPAGSGLGPSAGVFHKLLGSSSTGGVLSSAVETAVSDSAGDTFLAAPNAINAGDVITGGGGTDRIQLTSAGVADFTGVTMTGVEVATGSSGNDTFIFNGPPPASTFESGGGSDTLVTSGLVDLGALTFTGTWKVSAAANSATTFRLTNTSQIALVDGSQGALVIDASTLRLTDAERSALFAQGAEEILQPSGLSFRSDGSVLRTTSSTVANGQGQHSVTSAPLADGYLLTWVQDFVVYAQRFDGYGRQIGEATALAQSGAKQSAAHALGLADGGYLVTWTAETNPIQPTATYVQRFDSGDAKVGSPVAITTGGSADQASAVTLANGGYVLVWHQQQGSLDIVAQRFDATGAKVGSQIVVNSTVAYDQSFPAVAAAGDGFVVTWQMGGDNDNSLSVYRQQFDAAGAPVGGEAMVNTTTVGDQSTARIATLDDGGYVIVWTSQTPQGLDVYAQRYDVLGQKTGGETRVNTTPSSTNVVGVSPTADGYIVAWSYYGDALPRGLYTQRFDAQGQKVGVEVMVAASGSDFEQWPAAVGLSGGHVLSWVHYATYNSVTVSAVRQSVALEVDFHRLTAGADTVVAATRSLSVEATLAELDAADTLTGGAGVDILQLLTSGALDLTTINFSGFDVLVLAGGGDVVTASAARLAGLTSIIGGAGSDTLLITSSGVLDFSNTALSIERLVLSGGDDTLLLPKNVGDMTIEGAAGVDTLSFASAGTAVTVNLTLSASQVSGVGNLTLSGFENLTGSRFNDVLTTGAGANVLQGLAGDDVLQGGAGDDDLDGGDGRDTASYATATAGVTVSLIAGAQNTAGAGVDTLTSIENLVGSAFADRLTGDAGANVLNGGAGDDWIEGGAGDDTIIGGDGVNTASYANATAGVVVSAIPFDSFNLQATDGAGTDQLFGIQNLVGSAFDDVLTGTMFNNVLVGGAGDDTLDGGGGWDVADYTSAVAAVTADLSLATAQVIGGAGTDTLISIETLIGSTFDDILRGDGAINVLDGGKGSDMLFGGGGDDVLHDGGETTNRDFLFGGVGNDTYYVSSSFTGPADLVYEGPDVAGAQGGAGDIDIIRSQGEFFWDFYGVAEQLIVDTAAGSQIVGGTNNQLILGNSGNDVILAYGGSNVIAAGAGTDAIGLGLYGLAESFDGANIVVMGPGSGMDYVFDFESGVDKIDLSAFHFGISSAQLLSQAVNVDLAGTADDYCFFYLTGAGGVNNFVVFMGLLSSQLQATDFLT